MGSREALSLGMETELPNSLPGDDQDECLLLPGELCQHLCINTVGSYRCACFPGFSLQGDGRTCQPGKGLDSRGGAEADLARAVWHSCSGDWGVLLLPPAHWNRQEQEAPAAGLREARQTGSLLNSICRGSPGALPWIAVQGQDSSHRGSHQPKLYPQGQAHGT